MLGTYLKPVSDRVHQNPDTGTHKQPLTSIQYTIAMQSSQTTKILISIHNPQRTPPPCSTTVLLSSFSTFLCNRLLSSGLMTFVSTSSLSDISLAEVAATGFPLVVDGALPLVVVLGRSSEVVVDFRCRTLDGAGKLCLRSMASTVLWNRRKRYWARRRVEGRSMEFESSLTVWSEDQQMSSLSYNPGFWGCIATVKDIERNTYCTSILHQNASDAP